MDFVTSGVLSLGPFQPDTLGPQPGGCNARKIWVASQGDGHDDARLAITDPTGNQTVQHRLSGAARAFGVKQFYPGEIQVSLAGSYRLEATIGPDKMCVTVDYHR